MNPKETIDDLTRRFFAVFTTDTDGKVNLDVIHDLFIPQGLIVKNVGPNPEIYNLQQFIEPRARMFEEGRLVDFVEEELSERTEIFGNIAQRFCRYRKSGTMDGAPFETEGMKTIQFINTENGWKISALAWDDEV
ncbi:Nuclear transport factor 2 family protein [Sulfidibacter corallicola]|uniref:Nuclear transport factor 2 family protein n=1 Tax=Sulfidibacter corallicola TaxID=2818388 RepID=A0A8A4THI1_SULCO|nr:nuclear transport factor 2 family protein [Sulfidibacter corallicola]QTD49519.1 nuclear transport factor 2 family protein [Sulfidibacter corallicola]